VVGVLVGFVMFVRSCSCVPESPQATEQAAKQAAQRERFGDKIEAWVMTKQFVKDQLVSPGTADFGGWMEQTSDTCVIDLGQGSYTVNGWVDSQNRLGAKLRSYFNCKLRYVGNGNWKCESVDLNQR
jgi:hypothetical protein